MSYFVTPQWLSGHLHDPDLKVIDGSWHMPGSDRDAAREFIEGHIPGAVRFDIDAIADTASDLPHMLPDAATFGEKVGALGIGSDMTVVVYDSLGLFSAPRVWWSLVAMGARKVRLLEGGLPAWRAAGLPLEMGEASAAPARFEARLDPGRYADRNAVTKAMASGTPIVDARPAARFAGETPEPRPGLRAGHIPTSRNLPVGALVENGRLGSVDAIRDAVARAGVLLDRPAVTTCGSGVTAATLALALEVAGAPPARVYDGSWAEWGRGTETPVATGPQ